MAESPLDIWAAMEIWFPVLSPTLRHSSVCQCHGESTACPPNLPGRVHGGRRGLGSGKGAQETGFTTIICKVTERLASL